MRRLFRGEHGDTLIEVVFAITIMGSVLISSAALSSLAYRSGISARERTQAANIAQGQAEALRNLRDTARESCIPSGCSGWNQFRLLIAMPAPDTTSDFCMVKESSGSWVYETNPSLCKQGRFSVLIKGVQPDPTDQDLIDFDITVSWDDFAAGESSSTTISTVLTSQDGIVFLSPPDLPGAVPGRGGRTV